MSVVVWDGTTLAADRQVAAGQVKQAMTKLRRLPDGRLAGFVGAMGRGVALLDWLTRGADPATFPALRDDGDYAELLVVHPDGRTESYENHPVPMVWLAPPVATGSGAGPALGAIHAG